MDKEHQFRLRQLEKEVKAFNQTVKEDFEKIEIKKVDRMEFKPVQQIVFGAVAACLLALLGAVVALVLK